MMEQKLRWIDGFTKRREEEFTGLSREIWNYAETGMEEERSALALCRVLQENGFRVEKNLAGIPTAFVGSFGEGSPVIGFLGEFDALEGLSQRAGIDVKEPEEKCGNGHGCGHNLLGCGCLAAAVAVKEYMEEHGLKGTVRYYGCPGEEEGCGKVHMAKAGCFLGLDAALTWHPMDFNGIEGRGSLADLCMSFHFTGKSAHASSCPHMGRSALDALELLNIAANFMREHIIPEARIHYAITDAGGTAPNVIPARASAAYEVRAPKREQAKELKDRLLRAARGAAMMTDTEVEMEDGNSYSDYIPNDFLNRIAWEQLKKVELPVYTEEERDLAARLRRTFSERARDVGDEKERRQEPISGNLVPYEGTGGCLPVSTDVGDVSYLVPTVQLYTACCAAGTPGHSWQMVSQTGCSIGEKGMITAAKVLALTALCLFEKPELLKEAWEEHKRKVE
ncbi:amidohydrolase [Clostridium transplantifaecale]|uniref:amidohydrolase n=1 Tax=Clostridium transplantifaecale TaxID=2479838 RepID=UPI000F63CB7D|nr:amidohydrolase [Clostridium transplantifaecale]